MVMDSKEGCMARSQQRFVVEATDKHPDAEKYDAKRPQATWLDDASGKPWNWMPDGALDRLRQARDPQIEAVELARETLESAVAHIEAWEAGRTDKPPEAVPEIPDDPLDGYYVAGTLGRFQNRLVKGHEGEAIAEHYVTDRGITLVDPTTDDRWDSTKEAENDGVDLVDEDGTTYQVKAYNVSKQEREEMDADVLLEVVNGEVNKYYL